MHGETVKLKCTVKQWNWNARWNSEIHMKIIDILLAGITFSRMMNCYSHFQINTVHMQTLISRYSQCPTHCSPFHHWPYTKTECRTTHVCVFFFLYVSEIWPCFSETPCILSQVSRNLGLLHLCMYRSSTWSLMEIISEFVRLKGVTA
jgi:hypothetical protein